MSSLGLRIFSYISVIYSINIYKWSPKKEKKKLKVIKDLKTHEVHLVSMWEYSSDSPNNGDQASACIFPGKRCAFIISKVAILSLDN